MNIDQAYDYCEEVTRTEAKNFSYGIRILPAPKRRAMSALYAMARRIDDIGDGDASREEKATGLAQVKEQLRGIIADPTYGHDDPLLWALSDASRRFPIPLDAMVELTEGCEMDLHQTTYETFGDLVGYCRKVAGTVGRMSLGVYGSIHVPGAESLADDLGVALQLTNILRDIVEDQGMGRRYLPAEDLRRFGCPDSLDGPTEDLTALISFEAARAEDWYRRGLALLPILDRRSRACTAAMAGIYHRLLVQIQADPEAVLKGRVSLPGSEKLTVAAKSLVLGNA